MNSTLRDWQEEALTKWVSSGMKGTAKAATGVGKTIFGLAAMEHLGVGGNGVAGILIAVPTIFLQNQWRDEIIKEGVATEDQIGFVGDGNMDLSKPITIGVVNSLRELTLRRRLVILDEVHRYGSHHNFKFIARGSFDNILGFSATPERDDGGHKELMAMAPMFYDITQKDGVDAGILSKFELINVGIKLTMDEAKKYEELDGFVKWGMKTYGGFNGVQSACMCGSTDAADVMRAVSSRRQLLLKAESKIKNAPYIIVKESNGTIPKTLVFCEYIAMADKVKDEMEKFGFPTAVYHSGMSPKIREQMLKDFKEDKFKVMVTAKCLDEGVDVPDCELGIILGGTKVKRQMIQRLGRILRHRPGKTARMYQLYIDGTKDLEWLNKRSTELQAAATKVIWRNM